MIGDVKARFVRDDGHELTLGDGTWRIPNDGLENWANLPYSVSTVDIPSYDGALVTSKRVGAVDRSVTAVVAAPSENEAARYQAISFFNPKHTFKCYLTYMGRTRWCEGELYGFKASEGNMYEGVEIMVTLLCPNPYLKSVDDFGKDIAETVGYFGFPFMSFLPPEQGSIEGYNTGFITGLKTFSSVVELENDGDVPSGAKVRMEFNGETIHPSLKIGDNIIKFGDLVCKDGDVIDIDTESRPPTVNLNGSNALHLLDRESNIMSLEIPVGGTEIMYDAEGGIANMHVYFSYNKQYLGI